MAKFSDICPSKYHMQWVLSFSLRVLYPIFSYRLSLPFCISQFALYPTGTFWHVFFGQLCHLLRGTLYSHRPTFSDICPSKYHILWVIFLYLGSFCPIISQRMPLQSFISNSCIIARHLDERNDLFRRNNVRLGVIFFSNVVNTCSEIILVCFCIEIQRFLGTGTVILSKFAQFLKARLPHANRQRTMFGLARVTS